MLLSREKDVCTCWVEWLETFSWDWFCHLTFADPISVKGARRRFNKWVKTLGGMSLPYAVVGYERGRQNGVLHCHALVGGVGFTSPSEGWGKWFHTNGRCKVDILRGTSGVKYVCKYAVKDDLLDFYGTPLKKKLDKHVK